jgi:ribonuclease VapC
MVIDTSAIIAILQDEPERQAFNQSIAATPRRWLSAVSLVEISNVIESRFGSEGKDDFDLFL